MDTGRRILLLVGIDAIGTTRLPRLLSKAGFRVSLLAPRHVAAHRSGYVSQHFYAGSSPRDVVAAARERLSAKPQDYDAVIFGDEPVLWETVDEPAGLEDYLPFPYSQKLAQVVTSKNRFLMESRDYGLNVPRFEIGSATEDVLTMAERLGFPIFVKPERGMAGSAVVYAPDRASLAAQTSNNGPGSSYAVQEAIPGQCGATPVLFDHGRPECWFSYFKRRTWPNRFGPSCVAGLCDHPDVALLAHGVGAITKFHGLGGIDWIWHAQTGRLVLLEFNPRPTPAYHLGIYAGVDFTSALANWGRGTLAAQRPGRTGQLVRLFPQNLYRAIDDRNGLEFFRSFSDAPWSDPRLMAAHLRRVATHYLPDPLRLKFKARLPKPAYDQNDLSPGVRTEKRLGPL